MKKIFAYGTLLNPKVQQQIIGRIQDGICDSINGFVSVCDYYYNNNDGPYPRLVELKGGCVYGRILEFSNEELEAIDFYESQMYTRCLIITNSKKTVEVYMPNSKYHTYKLLKTPCWE